MTSAPSLPSDNETETLPACFSKFFMDKIVNLRSAIYSDLDVSAMHLAKEDLFPDLRNDQTLQNFQPSTEEEIWKIILALSSASCNLDPIPTPLLKICIEKLLQTITQIVNSSPSSCTFPDFMNSISNSTFIALNLCQKTDSKAHHTKTLFNIHKPETLHERSTCYTTTEKSIT